MISNKSKAMLKRLMSLTLIVTLILGLVTTADILYPQNVAHAASFAGSGSGVGAPAYNAANFPKLDTTGTGASTTAPTRKYYYGKYGEAFYAATDNSAAGTWELVDTDAKMNGTALSSVWNASNTKGCTILTKTNALTDTYFSAADKAGMKPTNITTDAYQYSNFNIGSFYYADTTVNNAYLWPLSASQYGTSINPTGNGTLTRNGLATALYNNAGADVWSRSFGGCNSGINNFFGWCINGGNVNGYYVDYSLRVAPAFNLDLNKVLIARSASSATQSQSFATASSNALAGSASGDLKFLVNAGSQKGSLSIPEIGGKTLNNVFANKTYTFNYSGASTSSLNGGTNYLSAILYDANGKVAYYGNLGKITAASGTGSITIPSELTGTYTLAIFEEEKCAANKTDYASPPVYAKFTVQTVDYETEGTILGDTLKNTTKNNNVANNGTVESGEVLTSENLTGSFTRLSGATTNPTVYLSLTAPSSTKVDTTSVTVPTGSSQVTVYAIIYPESKIGITNGYVAKNFSINVNYEKSTSFSQKDSTKSTLQVNDTFTSSMYKGTITWMNGSTSDVAEDNLYIVPASVWDGWNESERTKENVTGLTSYANGKTITVDSTELNGADTYSLYTVYFPQKAGAAAYHANKWTYASTSLYAVDISAECGLAKVDYGELITDTDVTATVKLSGNNNSMTAGQIYVLPTATWNNLSAEVQTSESKIKKVTGVNSVVIPSESDLAGMQEFKLTVVYFDYSEQNRPGSNGTACTNCTRFTTELSIPLVSSLNKDYLFYTKSGVTWYYQKEMDSEKKETGYAINVHTTNEDVNQYIDTNGVLNIPSEVNGYKVKSIGSGNKARPFVPANVNSFTNIKFPTALSEINDYAFYANTAFMRLVIPGSVTEIGDFAFYDCDNISIVTIHDTNIGAAAFGNCDGLIEVTIDGTGSIGKVAFAECSNLKKVTVSGTNNIGKSAFVNDKSLNALNLKKLTSSTIYEYAFKDCTSIQALSIPNSNQVKAYAFDGCSGITNLELDIAVIENHSFEGCYMIQYMIFGPNVAKVEYDWGGYSSMLYETEDYTSEQLNTTIYVKNKGTLFECYRDGTDVYSSFMGHYVQGSGYKYSRIIDTYVSGEGTTSNEHTVNGTLTSATLAYYAAAQNDFAETTYTWWDYVTAKGLLTVTMHTDANTGDANVDLETKRDGITAYYDGKIYDIDKADKEKVIVKPIYSDATVAKQNITDFYFFDENEADAAIRAWIKSTDYEFKNVIAGKLIENQVYPYSKYVEYCTQTATITEEELEYETKAMIASIFNNKENFLAATAAIIDNPTIQPVTSNQDYNIQHMMVIFYPTNDPVVDPDYNAGETGDLTYYLTGFDVKTVKYTAEQGFFDQGFTYSNVAEKIEELNSQIAALSGQVTELTAQRDQYQESSNEYQNKLQKAQQELAAYTILYNEIVKQLNEYIGSTEVADDKYFGTKVDPESGEKIPVVWINGIELTYEKVLDETGTQKSFAASDGNEYPIYSVIGDVEGNGSKYYEFYIASDGAHIIARGENKDTAVDVTNESIVYDETIRALQRKLTAQLTAIREELSVVRKGIDDIRALLTGDYLNYTDEEWNALSDNEKLEAITIAIGKLQNDYNTSSSSLTTAQNTVQNLNKVLVVLNKIGAGTAVTSEELALLSSISEYADLDQLVKTDSGSNGNTTQEDLDAYVEQLATIIKNGCADDPNTEANEYGVYDQNTLTAVAEYSSVISSVLEGMSNEITTLRTTVATQLSTIATQAQTILDKQAQIDALQSGDLSEAYAAAQAEIASLNNQLNGLSEEVEELSNQVLTMQTELSTLKTLIASIRSLLNLGVDDDILQAIKGLQDTIKSNAETIEQLKVNLEAAQGTIGKIQSKLSTTATGDALVALVGNSNSSNNSGDYQSGYTNGYNAGYVTGIKASNSDTELTSTIKNLTSQLASVQATNTTLVTENSNLKSKNTTLTNELSSKLDKLTASNKKLTSTNKKLTNANEALSKKVNNLTAEKSSLERTIATLRNSASNNVSSTPASTESVSKPVTPSPEPEMEKTKEDTTDEADNMENEFAGLGVNGEFTGLSSDVTAGTVISRGLPEETEKNIDSEKVSFIKLEADTLYADDFGTNAAALTETSNEQKNHANEIFAYYASHPEELARLGYDDIRTALEDETKVINVDAIGSVDVNASAAQKEAIENGEKVTVEIYGSVLEDGNMYFIVHESAARMGTYDVVLVQAENGKLSCELEDLSPISIAEVSTDNAMNQFTADQVDVESPTPQPEVAKENGALNTVFIILGILAIAGIAVAVVLMKRKKIKNK